MKNLYKNVVHFALALCMISLVACSKEERLERSEATLQGKLTYKGKPLPNALVIVAVANGIGSTGKSDADGNYLIPNAPAGEVQIGVNTDAGRGMMTGQMMAAARSNDKSVKPPVFIDIPKKYFEPGTSGIVTTVAEGKTTTTFDIEIK